MPLIHRAATALKVIAAKLGFRLVPAWRFDKLEESEHLAQLFRLLEIDCVLDVGANIGQYHEFLRLHVGYTGPIISFEPITELYDKLQRLSAADPNWTVHRLALGDTDSRASINVMAERTLSSLLPPNEQSLRAMGYDKYLRETTLDHVEDVPVRRLDALQREVIPAGARRVFMKSDTQGYDMAVIRGADGCLDRIVGLQVELPIREVYRGATDYLEALAELKQRGYAVTGFVPVQRDATLRVINVDCLFIREAQAERLRHEGRHAPGHADRP